MVTRPGKATRPLRLPTKAPRCFDSQANWNVYRQLAQQSAGDGFTFCVDCTELYRDEMVNQGRCKYPLTRFVSATGVIVGRRVK